MPRIVDKIIINSRRDEGNFKSRKKRFEILDILSLELLEHDIPLNKADSIMDKMRAGCTVFNQAERDYDSLLDECIDELETLINQFVT